MQTEFTFKSRKISEPAEFLSFPKIQIILTILSIAVAFFAILELALS